MLSRSKNKNAKMQKISFFGFKEKGDLFEFKKL